MKALSGRGGARPGAGRPPGSLSVRSQVLRNLSDEAIRGGVIPLEVMLSNMRYFHNEALQLQEMLQATAAQLQKAELGERAVELLNDVVDKMVTLDDLRMKAQTCALNAAAFVHPRLAQTQVTDQDEGPVRVEIEEMSPEERRRLYYEQLRLAQAGIRPNFQLVDASEKKLP